MKELLEDSFRAAVAAANPLQILPAHLPPPPAGRTFVAAAGKAAASMALAVEKHWPAEAPLEGIVGSSRVDLQACKLEYSIVSPK